MDNPFEALHHRLEQIENALSEIKELQSSQEEDDGQRMLGKKEAATVLGVSVSTIDNMRRDGFLQPYRFGKAVRFKLADLWGLAEARKTEH